MTESGEMTDQWMILRGETLSGNSKDCNEGIRGGDQHMSLGMTAKFEIE